MDRDTWTRVRALLERARELPEAERKQFARDELSAHPAERALLEALLAADRPDTFLEPPDAEGVRRGAPAPDWYGRRVGSFALERAIARGGMGSVYEAIQDDPERRVAIKLLHADSTSPAAPQRFRAEAGVLARLQHPGIAQVYEAGVLEADPERGTRETPWFAMELVEGALPLHAFADRHDLSVDARIELFLQVTDAVFHGHQRGVLHRDLKPANLLVDRAGRVKVIDFGIAKDLDASDDRTTLGEIVGTLLYASPEQLEGRHDEVDMRTDVYALGVVLYQLLCGVPPFDLTGEPLPRALQVLVNDEPPPPSSRRPELSMEVDWVIARAMAKERDRRYATVPDLARDLARFLRHEPLSAGPPTATYRLRKFVRRHRVGVGAGALVLLATLGGMVGTTAALVRTRRAERAAEAERKTAVNEAETAAAVVSFLVDMFGAASPTVDGPDVRVLDVLTTAAGTYGEAFADRPEVRSRMARALGSVYHGLGLAEDSQTELERGLEFLRALHDGPHPEIAVVLGNLGTVHLDAGRFHEAEAHLVESLELERRLDPASPAFHRAHVRMGRLRLAQGRRDDAQEHLRTAVEGLQASVGATDRDTLLAKNALGGCLHESGQLDGAERYYREALDGMSETLGERHPNVLTTRFNLAMLLHSRGQGAEAIELVKELVVARAEVLGEDHPDTLVAIMNLGGMLQLAGRSDEAEALYAAHFEAMRAALPAAHPILQTVSTNLAQLARAQGDLERAEELLASVYAARVEGLGLASERTLRVLYELAAVAREGGQFETAEERALAGLEAALDGDLERFAYLFRFELGQAWTALEAFEDAEQVLREAADFERSGLQEESTAAADALSALYAAWGRPADGSR